jgi:hypothetical protein
LIFICEPLDGVLCRKRSRKLVIFEADEADIEIFLLQSRELNSEQVLVPARIQCKLVVSDDVSAFLSLTQVSPSLRAARSRPCPAMMPAFVSTRMGLLNPNSAMLAAI